jgi:hypothetical protein
MKTMVLNPKWIGVLPLILHSYEKGGEARKVALQELRTMAAAADKYNNIVEDYERKENAKKTKTEKRTEERHLEARGRSRKK